MKKIYLLLLLLSGFALPGAVKLGEMAPELEPKFWISNEKAELSFFRNKAPVVIFFWTASSRDAKAIRRINEIAEGFRPQGIAFIAFGVDDANRLKRFTAAKQLVFPVAGDNSLKTLHQYWHRHDRIPAVALVGRDGKLLWRGRIERLPQVLDDLLKDKFDLNEEIQLDEFNARLNGAFARKDYKAAVRAFDAEIQRHPERHELYAGRASLYFTKIKDPKQGQKLLQEAQKKFPDKLQFYQMEYQLIRPANDPVAISKFYDRLIKNLSHRPRVLIEFARVELTQPFGRQLPFHAYRVAHAAYHAPHFKNKIEQGRIAVYYAQVLYYSGRVDLALQVAKRAMQLLKGTKDYDKAKQVIIHYNNILRLAPQIKE